MPLLNRLITFTVKAIFCVLWRASLLSGRLAQQSGWCLHTSCRPTCRWAERQHGSGAGNWPALPHRGSTLLWHPPHWISRWAGHWGVREKLPEIRLSFAIKYSQSAFSGTCLNVMCYLETDHEWSSTRLYLGPCSALNLHMKIMHTVPSQESVTKLQADHTISVGLSLVFILNFL